MQRRTLTAALTTCITPFFPSLLALLASGCSAPPERPMPTVIGRWVRTVEGTPGQTEGFELLPSGEVRSLDKTAVAYEHWRLTVHDITLTGRRTDRGMTTAFSDTYAVRELTLNTLLLEKDGRLIRYIRPYP